MTSNSLEKKSSNTASSTPKRRVDMTKIYEKNRRHRFNMKIEHLASLLPKYNKENPWRKVGIIENAIEFIMSRNAENAETVKLIKILNAEIKNLKEIILVFTEFKYQKHDIFKLSSVEIKVILKQLYEENNKLLDTGPRPQFTHENEKDVVDGDHSYSSSTNSTESTTRMHAHSSIAESTPILINQIAEPGSQTVLPDGFHQAIISAPKSILVPANPVIQSSTKPNLMQIQIVDASLADQISKYKPIQPSSNPDLPSKASIVVPSFISVPQKTFTTLPLLAPAPPTESQQKLIIKRGAKSFIVNGTAISVSDLRGGLSTTATVTVNTGSKSSVMDLLKFKRTYKRRKPKVSVHASDKTTDKAVAAAGEDPKTKDISMPVSKTDSINLSDNPTSKDDSIKCRVSGSKIDQVAAQSKVMVGSDLKQQNVDKSRNPSNTTCDSSTINQESSQSKSMPDNSARKDVTIPVALDNPSENREAAPAAAVGAVTTPDSAAVQHSAASLQCELSDVQTDRQSIGSNQLLSSVLHAPRDTLETVEDSLDGPLENMLENTGLESADGGVHSIEGLDSSLGEPLCKVPRLDLEQDLISNGKDDFEGLEELKKIENAGLHITENQTHKRLETSEELKIIDEAIKEDDGGEIKGERSVHGRPIKQRGEKKKSKSSYSIPALCQISVNIGDRPDVASSPGVLSLNSVGTISPSNTPVPTPDKSTLDNLKNSDDPVIEELKTIRPEELLQQVEITADDLNKSTSSVSLSTSSHLQTGDQQQTSNHHISSSDPSSAIISSVSHTPSGSHSSNMSLHVNTLSISTATISPSQTFLTSFPLVSKHNEQDACEGVCIQQEISQALKDLDRELNLENMNHSEQEIKDLKGDVLESMNKEDSHPTNKLPEGPPCSVPSSQSVYDFTCKPNSPPVPLQKSRKDSRSPRQAKEDAKLSKHSTENQKDMKTKLVEKKSGNSSGGTSFSGHPGYLDTQIDQLYVNQQTTNMKQTNYSHSSSSYQPAAAAATGSQHGLHRNAYMTPHYHYQGGGVSNQHSNAYQHTHPYSHALVTNADMKAHTFQQDPKYSCSNHGAYPGPNVQDFNARNYYKNYNTNQQYRGFNQTEQMQVQYSERKQRHHVNQQLIMQDGTNMADKSLEPETPGSGTFSVTQLVNSSQRKSSKKSTSSSSKLAKAKSESERKEREEKKVVKGSRRNRSGNRSNYSAESLLGGQHPLPSSTQVQETKEEKSKAVVNNSPYKNSSPKTNSLQDKVSIGGSSRSNTNWSNEVNQHFGGLPFSSLSPSPGLFSSDLTSFELGIFNSQDGSGGREYFCNPAPPQNKSSKQLTCQLGNQRSSEWGINSSGTIIDGSFLPPLPTLTPPTEDPMSYTFMSHSSGFYPCASVPSQRSQNVYTSNQSTPGCGTPTSMMPKGSGSQQSFHGQMTGSISGLAGKGSNSGSLINFNLSTIFPEINIATNTGANCQAKPLVGLPPLPHPEFLQGSRSGQLGSTELIPHSIPIIGGHSSTHQVPTFTVAPGITSNMVPGVTFPNIPES